MPKYSKHKKSSWKKQIDLNDVDNFLEDQRLEQRAGKPFEFGIETHGNVAKDDVLLEPAKRKLRRTKEIVSDLHCYKSLKVTTNVPALVDKRSAPRPRLTLKKKSTQPTTVSKKPDSFYDLWSEPKKEIDDEVEELAKKQRVLVGVEPKIVPPHLFQKPYLRSAVDAPAPGQSYNPKKEDHVALLNSAIETEKQKLAQEKRLKKLVTDNYVKKSSVDPNAWVKEMSQGLGGLLSDDEEEDDAEYEATPPSSEAVTKKIATCQRKTNAQRNRQKKMKQKQAEAKLKKKKDEPGVKNILKQFRERQQKTEEKIRMKEKKQLEKLMRGNIVDDTIDVSLVSELKGNLRSVAVNGNLLEDRFKSFQKRGLIEVIKNSKKKKPKLSKRLKVKEYMKKDHRPKV